MQMSMFLSALFLSTEKPIFTPAGIKTRLTLFDHPTSGLGDLPDVLKRAPDVLKRADEWTLKPLNEASSLAEPNLFNFEKCIAGLVSDGGSPYLGFVVDFKNMLWAAANYSGVEIPKQVGPGAPNLMYALLTALADVEKVVLSQYQPETVPLAKVVVDTIKFCDKTVPKFNKAYGAWNAGDPRAMEAIALSLINELNIKLIDFIFIK